MLLDFHVPAFISNGGIADARSMQLKAIAGRSSIRTGTFGSQ
jgi:hypothetical protein